MFNWKYLIALPVTTIILISSACQPTDVSVTSSQTNLPNDTLTSANQTSQTQTINMPTLSDSTDMANLPVIDTVEHLAMTLNSQLRQVIESTTHTTDIPKSGPVLIIMADTCALARDVQELMPRSSQPVTEQDIVFVASITQYNERDGSYIDEQPAYRIYYHVDLFLYKQASIIWGISGDIRGYDSPFIKTVIGPGYGDPPNEGVAEWIAEQTGTHIEEVLGGHQSEVADIVFNPTSSLLASIGYDGMLSLWDVATGQNIFTTPSAKYSGIMGREIDFSPDGKLLAFPDESNAVSILDLKSMSIVANIPAGEIGRGIWGLSFKDNQTIVTSGGIDSGVIFWDATTGKKISVFSDISVGNIVVSPNGKIIAGNSNTSDIIYIWDVVTKSMVSQIEMSDETSCISFNQNSSLVAISDWGGNVTIFDLTTNAIIQLIEGDGLAYAVAFNPDAKMLVFGNSEGEVRFCETNSGQTITNMKQKGDINTVVWSPDGLFVAFAGDDCLIRVWDVQSQKLLGW